MMKEKMKKFLRTYFGTLGLSLLLVLLLAQITGIPELFSIRMGNAVVLMLAVCIFAGTMILKSGVSVQELWLRRMAVILIDALATPGSMILCGMARYSSWERYLLYAGGCFTAITVLTVIIYCIADRAERRILKKINEKFREN